MFTFTPFGIAMGFLPILDISVLQFSLKSVRTRSLPLPVLVS
jgi:hypothetical protein